MKAILITVAMLATCAAHARSFKPYDPKPTSYEVDGKEVTGGDALVAAMAGKTVKLCKAMAGAQASKSYRINGKEVKGSELKTCDVQEVAETKTGLKLAKKK